MVIIAFNLPSQGLTLIGGALIVSSVVFFLVAGVMPQRTMAGSMVFAMLAAYKRTLKKSLDQARSLNEVIASKSLPWLETPDQAVVWGVGFGLHDEIESVIGRSTEDLESGRALARDLFPGLVRRRRLEHRHGSGGGLAPGLFSGSAIPDFGGMMSALGTIGNSPASSGSGGSGGFSGGGSSGGGGAGGGF